MARKAVAIELSLEERDTLEGWVQSRLTGQCFVRRARIVLMAADGMQNQDIARELKTTEVTVGKWRSRFAEKRVAGLQDESRPGAKRVYTDETERRILKKLDEPPPPGHTTWSGPLVAQVLGDVSDDQVWRVLRQHGVQLQRRRSWCVRTDPQFAAKAADIVGIYLDPPENAVVLSVAAESRLWIRSRVRKANSPSIQALEHAQGYLRLPDGPAITGQSHEYTRHGTTTLFDALKIATGQVKAGHYHCRRRREFLDFMNGLVTEYCDRDIHVILDNLSTHIPKNDQWLARHPNVQFHYTPIHASWLNQIECWFSILTRQTLRGASFTSPQELRDAIDAFIQPHNQAAAPFEWTKSYRQSSSLQE